MVASLRYFHSAGAGLRAGEALPHSRARRACRALRGLRAHSHRLQRQCGHRAVDITNPEPDQLPQPTLPEVPGDGGEARRRSRLERPAAMSRPALEVAASARTIEKRAFRAA